MITIENDDAIPSIEIGTVTVTEGDAGTVTANVPVTMTGTSSVLVTIPYTTTNDSAISGADYIYETGIVSWLPLQTGLMTIDVAVSGDYLDENTETF